MKKLVVINQIKYVHIIYIDTFTKWISRASYYIYKLETKTMTDMGYMFGNWGDFRDKGDEN